MTFSSCRRQESQTAPNISRGFDAQNARHVSVANGVVIYLRLVCQQSEASATATRHPVVGG